MVTKNKILYVITKSNWGGAQKYIFDISTSLPKDHYEILVAFGGQGELKQRLSSELGIRTYLLTSLTRDISILKDFLTFFELFKLFKKEQPNVVHLNSSKVGGIGSLAARLAGIKKIVFTAHGWAFNEIQRSKLSRLIIWKISWFTSILCTDIITLSQKEYAQTLRFPFLPSKKVHLIPNGIRTFNPLTKQEALDKLTLTNKHTYIGTIAELHKNKGIDILISAISDLSDKNVHLVIIGEGEELEHLEKLVVHTALVSRVHFLGAIPDAARFLQAFDIFVLASRKEGLPYVLLEAGIAEIPVIASNVGGIPEIICDNHTGLLSENNLVSKIEFYLQHKDISAKHAHQLKKHVEKTYHFENTLKLTSKVYTK